MGQSMSLSDSVSISCESGSVFVFREEMNDWKIKNPAHFR